MNKELKIILIWLTGVVLVLCTGFWFYHPKVEPIVINHVVKPAPQPQPQPAPIAAPDQRMASLSSFLSGHNCADLTYVGDYLAAADKYGLDFRLLPALSFKEENCTRNLDKNNLWGWRSGDTAFESVPAGIYFVAQQLRENHFYAGKTTDQKLRTYNHHPGYAESVESIMAEIAP